MPGIIECSSTHTTEEDGLLGRIVIDHGKSTAIGGWRHCSDRHPALVRGIEVPRVIEVCRRIPSTEEKEDMRIFIIDHSR